MVSLLESKLYSLPSEITTKYPPLTYYSLNDINPQILSTNIYEIKSNEVKDQVNPQPVENKTEEIEKPNEIVVKIEEKVEVIEETPEKKLKGFLEENNSDKVQNIYKMLKFGIPEQAVLQKARFTGIELNVVNVRNI